MRNRIFSVRSNIFDAQRRRPRRRWPGSRSASYQWWISERKRSHANVFDRFDGTEKMRKSDCIRNPIENDRIAFDRIRIHSKKPAPHIRMGQEFCGIDFLRKSESTRCHSQITADLAEFKAQLCALRRHTDGRRQILRKRSLQNHAVRADTFRQRETHRTYTDREREK